MKKAVINVQCCSHMQRIMPISCISVKVHGGIILVQARNYRPGIEKDGVHVRKDVALGGARGTSLRSSLTDQAGRLKHIQ